MIWLGASVVYAVCGLVCARMVAGHAAWTMLANDVRYHPRSKPDGAKWFGGWCLGLLAAFIWPAVLFVAKMPTSKLAVGAEADAIRRRQAERIAELEREAGIR